MRVNKSTKKNKVIKELDNNCDQEVNNKVDIKENVLTSDEILEKHDNKIELTKDQNIIYDELINFIKSPKDNEIILIGYAGTGKTTLVTKLINDIIKIKLCKKITIAAPTHKAVNIAKSKLFDNIEDTEELSKNIDIMTIHRLLNYQSYIDTDTGEKYFAKSRVDPNWTIYDLIVVDECSMLSNQIINDISDQIKKEVNSGIKIIYVGDPAQLPPVNQPDSKIFNKDIKKLTLDKIIRTKNQKIMDLSNDHRKWIFSKKNDDIPNVFKYTSDKIKMYSAQNKETNEWLNNFVDIIKCNDKTSNNITDSYDNNIILTWTNKKCNNYNQYVRQKIFNKKELEHFEIGEILIFNDFYRYETFINNDDDLSDKEEENKKDKKEKKDKKDKGIKTYISFYTSEQVKLVRLEKIKFAFNQIKIKKNPNLTEELNEKFVKRYEQINKLIDIELDAFELDVKRISDIKESGNETDTITHTIYSIHPNSEKEFNSICEEFETLVLKARRDCYKIIEKSKNNDNMTKCSLQGEVDKKINKLYKDWQSSVTDKFAQLNYGYSITVHKSQGSTFKNVFIDISDILDNNNIDETSKCLYTAITRSSNKLELLL